MKRTSVLLILLLALSTSRDQFTGAQKNDRDAAESETCQVAIYKSTEVDRRVKIVSKPEPEYPAAARRKDVSGAVVLSVVFCGSGKVTDISVINGLPYGITEKVIEAARKIEFIPAEKDGKKVSQRLTLQYNYQMY